ncbi:MAG: hypothetical protein DRR19_26705, partial [Candidatus Parabeggiatoa sp. nov. 1]
MKVSIRKFVHKNCWLKPLGLLMATLPLIQIIISVKNLQGFRNLEGFALLSKIISVKNLQGFRNLEGFALLSKIISVRNLQGFRNLEGFALLFRLFIKHNIPNRLRPWCKFRHAEYC